MRASRRISHAALPAKISVFLCMAATVPGQSAADLEKGANASREAHESVDFVSERLAGVHRDVQATLAVLRASYATLSEVGLKQAATDIAAQITALTATEKHLNEQIRTLARLRTDGAPAASDPLQDVLVRIASARVRSTSKDRLSERMSKLGTLLKDVTESAELQPFVGLVHYHIADTYFDQAVAAIGRKQDRSAKKLYGRAIKSFERAADDAVPEIRNTGVGTSLKAAAIYRIVVLHAAIYQSPGTTSGDKKKHRRSANRWFDILRKQYASESLGDQRNVVSEARRQALRMR
jgi:hypothetical protein